MGNWQVSFPVIPLFYKTKPLVEAIKEHCEAKVVDLISFEGQTEDRETRKGGSRRVWTFGD
jgi:hypothetical protein